MNTPKIASFAFLLVALLWALSCIKPVSSSPPPVVVESIKDTVLFTSHSSTQESISLLWTPSKLPVDSFLYYVVEIKGVIESFRKELRDTLRNIIITSHTFAKLSEGELYSLRITSHDKKGNIRAFDEFSFRTKKYELLYVPKGSYQHTEGSLHYISIDAFGTKAYIGADNGILLSDEVFNSPPILYIPSSSPVTRIAPTLLNIVYSNKDSLCAFDILTSQFTRIALPEITQIKPSADGLIFYVSTRDSITAYDTRLIPSSKIKTIKLEGKIIKDFDFTPTGNRFYLATGEGLISYDRDTDQFGTLLAVNEKNYKTVHIASNGNLYVGRSAKGNDIGNISFLERGNWELLFENASGVFVDQIFSYDVIIYALISRDAYIYFDNRWILIPPTINTSSGSTLFFTSLQNTNFYTLGKNRIDCFSWTLK